MARRREMMVMMQMMTRRTTTFTSFLFLNLKGYRFWLVLAGSMLLLLMLVAASLYWFSPLSLSPRPQPPFAVRVFVINMFAAEAKPWLSHGQWPDTFTSPGADNVVHCTPEGLCLTITGVDKANAAASTFDQPHSGQAVLDFLHAHFRVNDIATANLYLVGSTLVHYLLALPH